jgi:hypothetical protein
MRPHRIYSLLPLAARAPLQLIILQWLIGFVRQRRKLGCAGFAAYSSHFRLVEGRSGIRRTSLKKELPGRSSGQAVEFQHAAAAEALLKGVQATTQFQAAASKGLSGLLTTRLGAASYRRSPSETHWQWSL